MKSVFFVIIRLFNSEIMSFLFLLVVLLINAIFVFVLEKPFGKLIPLTIMFMVLLTYASGFLHNFNYAFFLIIIISSIGAYILIKNRQNKKFILNYFNVSFYIIIALFVIIVILHHGRRFMFIDEFCHLGLMARESYRLNEFHAVGASQMWYNKEYPPFYALLEVLYCKFSGGFEERYCYQAMTFFNLLLYLFIFDNYKLKKDDFFKILCSLISVLLIGATISFTPSMAYNTLFYNSIYLDLPIGLLLGYIFFNIYKFDYSVADYCLLTVSLCSLVLTKQISIAFYLLAVVTLILLNISIDKYKGCIKNLVVVTLPLLVNFSWTCFVSENGITSKFDTRSFDFLLIIKYFKKITNDYQTDIISKFFKRIITASTIIKPFKMSYVIIVLIMTIILFTIGYLLKDKKITIISIMYFLGSVGYAYAMMLSYVYSFGAYEGPYLTMFDRYMQTYIFFGYVLLFLVISTFVNRKISYVVIIATILGFTSYDSLRTCKPILKTEGMLSVYNRRYVDFVDNLETEKVLVISQNDPLMRNVLRYYTIDYDKNTEYLDVEYAENANYDSGVVMWEDEFADYLQNFDYIYLCDYDESFFHYKGYFYPEVNISHIYEIEWNNKFDVTCKDVTLTN